jgi:integrase
MRAWNRLTSNAVRGATARGRYADGGGLFLQVAKGGHKAWVFQYTRGVISRAMGLGSVRVVPLATARDIAAQARNQLARRIDPIDERERKRQADRAARAMRQTFEACALEHHGANSTRWKNAKHKSEWLSTLKRYVFPIIGRLWVTDIDSALVYKVLSPIIADGKNVTASRVRGRIEVVLDFAKAAGRRTGDNPADKNVIAHMLPLKSEKADVEHHPALPHAKLAAFMAALRGRLSPTREARNTVLQMEMIVLSAMRHSAVRLARKDEFKLDGQVPLWTIPRTREGMKLALKEDHEIPLTPRMVAIVRELLAANPDGPFLFGGSKPGSRNGVGKLLAKLLQDIGHEAHAVPHGFRSTLQDWADEERDYPEAVVEQMLGHSVSDSVKKAYKRSTLLKRRMVLMLDWQAHCDGKSSPGVVVPMAERAA